MELSICFKECRWRWKVGGKRVAVLVYNTRNDDDTIIRDDIS